MNNELYIIADITNTGPNLHANIYCIVTKFLMWALMSGTNSFGDMCGGDHSLYKQFVCSGIFKYLGLVTGDHLG
jgi:hypothetical protein